MVNRDGRSRKRSKKKCTRKHKKIKPIRRDGYTTKQALQTIDLSYIDEITRKNKGRKGFKNSSLIKAMLLMYIRGMDSLLELERFLRVHKEWLYFLNLKRNAAMIDCYNQEHFLHMSTCYLFPFQAVFPECIGMIALPYFGFLLKNAGYIHHGNVEVYHVIHLNPLRITKTPFIHPIH